MSLVVKLPDMDVFTTGEVADLSRVSQQTVIRNFDNGKLQGFRVPGSRFRRISRDSLIRWLVEYGYQVENASTQLLLGTLVLIDAQDILVGHLGKKWKVDHCRTVCEGTWATALNRPELSIVSFITIPVRDARQFAQTVRTRGLGTKMVAIANGEMDAIRRSFGELFDAWSVESHVIEVLTGLEVMQR